MIGWLGSRMLFEVQNRPDMLIEPPQAHGLSCTLAGLVEGLVFGNFNSNYAHIQRPDTL